MSISAESIVRSSLDQQAGRQVPKSVLVTAAAMAAIMSTLSILRHRTFLSGTFDMAFYVQDVWAIANGVWANTVSGFHVFADHLSPVLIFLSPLASLPTAELLVLVQAVAVAAGIIPAYRLGSLHGGHRQGLLVATWYGASAAIWYAVVYDFHPVTLGVPLLMWLIADIEGGKKKSQIVLVALAMALIREDMAVLGGVVLVQAAIRRRNPRLAGAGLLVAGIGIGYIAWITTWSGGFGGYNLWARFEATSSSQSLADAVAGVVANLVRPDSLVSAAAVLLPVLVILPFRGWRQSWPGLAIIFVNCAASYRAQSALYYQYFAPAVPFLIWGSSRAFAQSAKSVPHRYRLAGLSTLMVLVLLGPLVYWGFGLPDRFASTILGSFDRTKASNLLATIPPTASVSATDRLLPHLAKRRLAYPFPGPMQCSQSLIFHVSRTFYPEYVALEWDAFGTDVNLRDFVTSWGYEEVIVNSLGGVWVLRGKPPPSQQCPSVEDERRTFTAALEGG